MARILQANEDLVSIGVCCMDIKLGAALKANKLSEHVSMSLSWTKKFLDSNRELTAQEKSIIYNSVETHHGAVKHNSLESEIVTNADCYRFIHPTGVTWWNAVLGTRTQNFLEILKQLNFKLEEKWHLVSLPIVKKELEPYYKTYKQLFKAAAIDF